MPSNLKLNNDEKITIQEMFLVGHTYKDIAQKLNRHTATVKNYLDGFQKKFQDHYDNNSIYAPEPKPIFNTEDGVYESVFNKMVDEGYSEEAATNRLANVIEKLEKNVNAKQLYALAIKKNAGDLMITRTDTGRPVSIMTKNASEKLDSLKKTSKKNIRDTRYIFSTKGK